MQGHTQARMAGRPLAAALQTCDAALDDAIEDELLTTLPRESDSTRIREPSASLGSHSSSARPLWLDGAVTAATQGAPPPITQPGNRPKRGMEASPFAGAVSKKPFRRRAFEHIQEELEEPKLETLGAAKEEVLDSELPNKDTITTGNLMSRLPSVPSVVTTNTFMQVSISPQIWRTREEAGRLMLNVGLQAIQLDGQQDLQLYLYSTLNPRIVTTGIPRPVSSSDLIERTSSLAQSLDGDAEEGRTRSAQSSAPMPTISHKKTCEGLLLDEVFLVRRDPQRRIPDEVFHTRGPFEGRKELCLPDWPGDIWRFDLCCKVNNKSDEVIWVKSLDRRLQ